MTDLILLPSTTYTPQPPQGRRGVHSLNTIIEEGPEDSRMAHPSVNRRRNRKSVKINQWLSPLSDHFPTPRGFHFLPAPIVPSTPSAVSDDCDAEETSSETSSSIPSSRMSNQQESIVTDATDFDDLSDFEDDDRVRKEQLRANGIARQHGSRSSRNSRNSQRVSKASIEPRKGLTPLVIPAKRDSPTETWSGDPSLRKKIASPVAPTPSSKVELPPVQLAFMQAQQASEVPTVSAPPSLDGSLNSEELAAISAPPTPIIRGNDDDAEGWAGVQLQPGALATLQALSRGDEVLDEEENQVIEVPQEEMSEMRQQPARLITNVRPTSMALVTVQQRSLAGLTKLEIPSPGGFFSELSSASRNTWHIPSIPGDDVGPPTSTTAEQFYKTPWNKTDPLPPPPPRSLHMEHTNHTSTIVEQVVEMPQDPSEDLPTAFRIQPTPEPITARKVPPAFPPNSARAFPARPYEPETPGQPSSPVDATEIVVDHDPDYARQQRDMTLSHLDRTELWLMAQRAYLNGVIWPREEHEKEDAKDGLEEIPAVPLKDVEVKEPEPETSTAQKKKTVRFSEAIQSTGNPKQLPSKLARQESAYYRSFMDFIIRSRQQDAFVHRLPRFEALQAQRVSLGEAHRNQLLGKHQLSAVPESAKKRMSANVARGDDVLVDDPEKLRADKEREALGQMAMATWHVAATKLLNGGQLVSAPVAKHLARLARQSSHTPAGPRDRARILDLGGQGACDWAWHAALKYPNAKVYTVTTKVIRQLSNSNIRGPPNHRQVAVERLTRLPFADGHFEVVSARELHSILKFAGENGEDEWEACLAECERVLKPGGYLDFSVLDSDIINAGPRGLARSVEFGFALKTLGYDPTPSRLFLGRLSRAGFEGVRRAWVCLPVGPKPTPASSSSGAPPSPRDPETGLPVRTLHLEAMVSGSADGAAAATGLAASWAWERWLLRAGAERAAGELRLAGESVGDGEVGSGGLIAADAVHGVIEEGRRVGAAFRMLRGYARKSRARAEGMGVISMMLDAEI